MENMKLSIFILMVLLCFMFIACDNTYFSTVSRVSHDPVPQSPDIASYSRTDGILVRWKSDPLADKYILTRNTENGSDYKVVYIGEGTSYLDSYATALPSTMYLYSVAAVRGSKVFPAGDIAYGVYDNQNIKDPIACNDTKENAIIFDYNQINEHLFYYSIDGKSIVNDTDWFAIEVPANKMIYLQINFDKIHDDSRLSYAMAVINNASPIPVKSGDPIQFLNGTNEKQLMYLSVYANTNICGNNFSMGYQLKFLYMDVAKP